MAKLLGGSQIYGNATVNSYLVVSGNADLSGGNVAIGTGNTAVTSIVITNRGTGYTTNPTITVSAPTTLYSGTATANANLGVYGTPTISSGGTGYAVGNTLTMVGTANAVSNATFTVTSVSSGVITGVSVATPGVYFSSNTTSPVTVTGGAGTGATLTVNYGVNNPTVTYGGTGYVEPPSITITGGAGSNAAGYPYVGTGAASVKFLNSDLYFNSTNGSVLRLSDNSLGPVTGYLQISPAQNNGGVTFQSAGSNPATPLYIGAGTSGSVNFFVGSSSFVGLKIPYVASATNWTQISGAAAGSGVIVSAQGSDADIDLNLNSKGLGNTKTAGNLVVSGNTFFGSNASFGASNLSTISLQGQLQPYTVVGTDGSATNTILTFPDVNWTISEIKGGVVRNVMSRNSAGDIGIGQNYTGYIGSIQLNAGSAGTSQVKFVTGSTGQYTSNFDNAGNLNVASNLVVTGNVSGGGVRSTTSSTPPASPVVGDVWYNSATDTIYRYTQDSTSSYWLNIFGPTVSSNASVITGSTYSNSNVASYLVTNTGNIAAGNITATGTIQYGSGQGGLVFRTLAGGTGAAIYNTNIVPSAQNYAMTTDGASVTFNAPTGGGIYSGINNSIVTTVQAGNLSVTGNVIQTGYQVINSNINLPALQIIGAAIKGGVGYHDFLSVTNLGSGVSNPNKYFRINNLGSLEIINSAYTQSIFTLTDSGSLIATTAAGGSGGTTTTLGYLGVPQNSQSSGYTLALSDQGKHIYVTTTGQTITIPANGTVVFPIGSTITIISAASVTTTVAITTDTLILAGQGTTGSRTIAPYGMATLIKVTSTSWYISGLGVS
jgi:hypothetical protein